jgi:hypothetical protein
MKNFGLNINKNDEDELIEKKQKRLKQARSFNNLIKIQKTSITYWKER